MPSQVHDSRFRLVAPSGISAEFSSWGASLVALNIPDRAGRFADVVLGFDTASEYAEHSQLYFGSTIGRVANRIRGSAFQLGDTTYELAANDGPNHLHGGATRSFDKVDWTPQAGQSSVVFRYTSPHLEEGYPGRLDTSVTYTLSPQGELRIGYEARSDRPTPVSLTNHTYWNLSGDGAQTILDHELQIHAERYTVNDDERLPTGEVQSVDGTALDFRKPQTIGSRIAELEATGARGYDHNYILSGPRSKPAFAARLRDPPGGRAVEIWTAQPCLQLYTGDLITPTTGKLGARYGPRSGVCLEPQGYPDAVHHPAFDSVVLQPGDVYRAAIIHRLKAG